jgi:hypothetical protein
MLSKILRGAVLATFAVGATVAQADVFGGPAEGALIWSGFTNSSHGVVTNKGSWNAGQFYGSFDAGETTLPNTYEADDFFRFFCIDLYAGVGQGIYKRVEGVAQSTLTSAQNSANSAQLTRLYDLYYLPIPHPTPGAYYFGGAQTNFGIFANSTDSAAMQLAVWEIWYGDDLSLANSADGFYWTGSGGCSGNAVCNRAQQMLSGVANASGPLSGTWNFYQFQSAGYQDYLSATYIRAGNEERIPLPGTLALFGIGLAGLGLARRKS